MGVIEKKREQTMHRKIEKGLLTGNGEEIIGLNG